MKGTFKKNGHKKRLSKKEIDRFVEMYSDKHNWELERIFNISPTCVNNIRRRYDLHKTERILNETRFRKGHKPFNKNKKHPVKSSTQFKPGHIPKNHREVGSIRLQRDKSGKRYYMIKIAEPNKWDLLHRYKWKQKYGEIPEGMLLVFKDGNTLNTDTDNCELITRKENMERNRNYDKFRVTMKELWRREKIRAIYGLKRYTKLRVN